MAKQYNPKTIEKKWQKYWEQHPELSQAADTSTKKKFYILDMFPYPSADGLHVGHVENYAATDIYSRFKRLNGFEVLHPIGWDAFGLPAENFAIKTGVHPNKKTHANIKNFTRQIKSLGISYDWSREIDTSSPEYYKWTQWFFLFLYKNGLAYRKKANVNWCPSCQTVLANEQVVNGVCERCKSEVVQKELEQWFFKITDFIEDHEFEGRRISGLLSGLEKIDWPESTKKAQQNWIGRSEGAMVKFALKEHEGEYIEVFTTRVDTIFSGTFLILAPEHPLIEQWSSRVSNLSEVREYAQVTKTKTELERISESGEKTGVEVKGITVLNPATGEDMPVWVSDFVLGQYGTGAVFADAHDDRDFMFAKKYNIKLKVSVHPEDADADEITAVDGLEKCFSGEGVLVHSDEFDGLSSMDARLKITEWLEKKELAEKKVNYRVRDWLVSRQRYWGAPIPIIYCDACGTVPVPEKDLPVKLPTDVDFRPTGESPLVSSKSFQNVKCPTCGAKARREADTLDTFVCSSWYYLRFADPNNSEKFADPEKLEKWLPVDFYMGGAEHTVLHLLYARFFTKALRKYGYVRFDEPFVKLRHQGMVLAEDGHKMSKSLGNVVNPDDVVSVMGADTLRLYEMFMGPLEESKSWNTASIVGLRRFLEKAWKLQNKIPKSKGRETMSENVSVQVLLHKTIKKVTEDIELMRFNTAISALMVLANGLEKETEISLDTYEAFLILLAPFAPHISEELWEQLGHKESIFLEAWPTADPKFLKAEEVEVVVQVNGKLRARVKMKAGSDQLQTEAAALEDAGVKAHTDGKQIRKVIFIADKLLNFVVG